METAESLEATTLASLASVVGSTTLSALMNGNLSTISEEDELKLLNFPTKREDLTTAIPLTVIFALLLVTGCIGNMCTAIVIARPKNKYMHTATNYYLFSLAMSDFLFLILGLPQEMYTLWQRYPYAFGESFCIIRGYLSEASTYASILTISAFTVERYVAICHPLWAHTMSQLPRAITSIVIIWILAAICAIPPAAELGIITQKGPLTNRTLEESAQCATKRTIYENMFVVSAIVFFIVPMIIVTVLYILIAIELRRSSRMNSAISKQTSSHLYSSSSVTRPHQHQHQHHNHHHHHHYHHQHQHHHQYPHKKHHNQQAAAHQLARLPAQLGSCPNSLANTDLQCCRCCCCTYSVQHAHARGNTRSSQHLASSNNNNNNAQLEQMTHQPNETTQSLMANIMSQRPSSAIGTEHSIRGPVCQVSGEGCSPTPATKRAGPLSTLWPPSFRFGQQQQQKPATTNQCHCLSSCYLSADSNKSCCLADKLLTQRQPQSGNQLCHSQSNQYESRESIAVAQRQHSPLSYHESLIQRQPNNNNNTNQITGLPAIVKPRPKSPEADQPTAAADEHADDNSNKLCAPFHRQLSPSPSNQSMLVRNLSSCCPHHNNHRYQRHHHHHHYGHHHQHPARKGHHHSAAVPPAHNSQLSRRSAAASSKKSVVRMLVAVVVSFFICWVPFHAQRLLASYLVKDENQNQLLLDIYLKLTYISGVMYYLSSTINPLLYQLMSAKFRLAFKETFNCSLFKCAIFKRRSSTGHHLAGQSPTNSLREPNSLMPSTHLARSLGHSHHQQPPELSGVYSDCLSCHNLPSNSDELESQQYSTQYQAAGMMARLRNRLNTSLVSLFRLTSNDTPSSCYCCCYSNNLMHHQQQHNKLAQQQGGCHTNGGHTNAESNSGRFSAIPLITNNNNDDERGAADHQSQYHGLRPSASCASTPLLVGHSDLMAPTPEATRTVTPMSPTFPAHSMLKFIKSTTPLSSMSQIPASLTRLSSHEEELDSPANQRFNHKEQMSSQQALDALIKPTNIDTETTGAGSNVDLHVQSLTLTSESGNSSGSSPEQRQQQQQHMQQNQEARDAGGLRRQPHHQKVSSASSNGSASSDMRTSCRRSLKHRADYQNNAKSQRKRRSSLQQHQTYLTHHQNARQPMILNGEGKLIGQRRKSSSSSANNKHFSSSLSSSDRQLDKKLSLSTTTSALDDCGSFTTTNSQLTGCGSNPTLATQSCSLSRGPSSSAIEDEPTTVIPLQLNPLDCQDIDLQPLMKRHPLLTDDSLNQQEQQPLKLQQKPANARNAIPKRYNVDMF